MAAEWEGRREERQGDTEAVAVEELCCVQCEGGGERQVVHLEEHGRGRDGGVAEAGAGDGGQRRVGRKELACEVGKECVGEGVLRAAAGSGGEQADGEGAVGGGEAGAERLMRAGGVGGGDGGGEEGSKEGEGVVGSAEEGRRRRGPGGGVGEDGLKEGIGSEGGEGVGEGAEEGGGGE